MVGCNCDHADNDDRPVLHDADDCKGQEIASEILWVANDSVRSAGDKRCCVHVTFPLGNAPAAPKEEDRKPPEYRGEAEEHTAEYAQPTQRP